MTLAEALDGCSLELLREIARRHGLASPPEMLRREMILLLGAQLVRRAEVESTLGRLSAESRSLFERIVRAGAPVGGTRIRSWLALGLGQDAASSERAIRELVAEGLAYRTLRAGAGEALFVPDDLARLAEVEPAREAQTSSVVLPVDARILDSNPALELVVLAEALRRADGRVDQVDLSQLPASSQSLAFDVAPAERWPLLTSLGIDVGWLDRSFARLRASPALREALERPALVRRRLLDSYLRLGGWDDLARSGLGASSGDSRPARVAVVEALADLREWTASTGLIGRLASEYPLLADRAGSTERFGAQRLATYLVLGPLHWLGLVRVATMGDQVWIQPRPAPARANTVRTAEGPALPPRLDQEGALSVGDDTPLGSLLDLIWYLDWDEQNGWRFSRRSFAAGLRNGGSSEHARRSLSGVAGGSTWIDVTDDWARRAAGATLEDATILDLAGHPDLASLTQDALLAGHLQQWLGPGEALLKQGHERAVTERLADLGVNLARDGQPRAMPNAEQASRDSARLRSMLRRLLRGRSAADRQSAEALLERVLSRVGAAAPRDVDM